MAAFVFPGQGPQEPAMLTGRREEPFFLDNYPLLADVLGRDLLAELPTSPGLLDENLIASTVTVFTSALELARLADKGMSPRAVAGYSVGQWSAMYAAGMLTLEEALRAVHARARIMDASPATSDGAMLAVIGLATGKVEDVCRAIEASGDYVAISNFNCLGQLSLGGTRRGIERAEEALAKLDPRKLARIPVSGAWHGRLLDGAVPTFRAALDEITLRAPTVPVADNVTGAFLPEDPGSLRDTLAAHLASPVRWDACVRALIGHGAKELVEVGFGDMLTKFGFFIDRGCRHTPSKKVV